LPPFVDCLYIAYVVQAVPPLFWNHVATPRTTVPFGWTAMIGPPVYEFVPGR